MKFLIQKINGQLVHDFSFTLLESIRYNNWIHNNKGITYKFINAFEVVEPDDIYPITMFKPYHKNYVPIGSVDFVEDFLMHFYNITPKPINVPKELFHHPSFDFTKRKIFNGNHMDLEDLTGKYFLKSNCKIKGNICVCDIPADKSNYVYNVPADNYQISEFINVINSEWRAFVYQDKLVGLQNYAGDFTMFPDVSKINAMIKAYKSAPIAYTLDIGIGEEIYDENLGFFMGNETFVIECHDFFSCGLYGFADHKILPYMFSRWFNEYIKKLK
jgi:hypothetical protein